MGGLDVRFQGSHPYVRSCFDFGVPSAHRVPKPKWHGGGGESECKTQPSSPTILCIRDWWAGRPAPKGRMNTSCKGLCKWEKRCWRLHCFQIAQKLGQPKQESSIHYTTSHQTRWCLTLPHSRWAFARCFFAEAPCSHVVELARAEVAANPASDALLRGFAGIKMNDAELGVHSAFRRHGLSSRVSIHYADLAGLKKFPYIPLSCWVKYLLETGRFAQQLCGCVDMGKMRLVLLEYWRRFRALFPAHQLFERADAGLLDLSYTVPFHSHTDEGRSQKHDPLWIMSCHGAIGRGSRLWLKQRKHLQPISENQQGLNFVGHTFSNQFLICTLLRKVSNQYPGALDEMIKLFATDCASLATSGVVCDGVKIWLVHIGTKGDLPALSRVGNFCRAFSHVPKRPSTRKPCEGICHLCLGGQEANAQTGAVHVPYEDMSENPIWEPTMHAAVPWTSEPNILKDVLVDAGRPSAFFLLDIWHNFHLGVAKHWTACALVAVVESQLLPRQSVELKLASLTTVYQAFCKDQKLAMWITDISRDTLNWPQSSAAPVGKWNKGSCSTTMMLFLDHYCKTFVVGKTEDSLLLTIVTCKMFE